MELTEEGIPDRIWWRMCDFSMSLPVKLQEADLCKPFVYERRWGVFYVPMGMHQGAMSLLLALQHGERCGIDVAEKLGLEYSGGTAEHWLRHTKGAAFRSSVGKTIQVGTFRGMTVQERRLFTGASCALT